MNFSGTAMRYVPLVAISSASVTITFVPSVSLLAKVAVVTVVLEASFTSRAVSLTRPTSSAKVSVMVLRLSRRLPFSGSEAVKVNVLDGTSTSESEPSKTNRLLPGSVTVSCVS